LFGWLTALLVMMEKSNWTVTERKHPLNVFNDSAGNLSQAAYAKVMRAMWFIDWSDVKIGIAGTNAV
jgi:hypothetical protein